MSETRPLTPRQREIADLVAQGYTNKDICAATGLSRRVVETHIGNIAVKWKLDPSKSRRVQIALLVSSRAA